MHSRQRNLNSAKHKPTGFKTPRANRVKKTGKTEKQIILKNNAAVEQRSGTQAAAATKSSIASIKKAKEEQKIFFGLDLHKKFLQVVAVDQERNLLTDKRVENDFGIIEQMFSAFPENARYILESSSARHGACQKLAGDLDPDIVLSNPYLVRLMTKSKRKTDRFGYMALIRSSCLIFLISRATLLFLAVGILAFAVFLVLAVFRVFITFFTP